MQKEPHLDAVGTTSGHDSFRRNRFCPLKARWQQPLSNTQGDAAAAAQSLYLPMDIGI